MYRRLIPILIFPFLAACQKPGNQKTDNPNARLKVLIGATTIVAATAQPIDDSIIVVDGSKIRSVGMRKDVPVPQNSDRTDLTGSWIVPANGSRIAIGETANLLILHHAPNGIEPANPADAGSRIVAGEWQVAKPH